MKKFALLINILVVCSLLLTVVGTPGLAALAASISPGLPDAIIRQMPPPIRQWLGLQRLDNNLGDTDIFPTIVPPYPDFNDPSIIGSVPDTSGAVGYTHYLQAVNKMAALYQKDGTLVEMASFEDWWDDALNSVPSPPTTPCTDDGSDDHHGQPYVIYDHESMRWVVMDVAYPNIDLGPYYLCVAVSKSNMPIPGVYFSSTNWFYYSIPVEVELQSYYPDMPKLTLWPDGYYLSADLYDIENNGITRNYRGVKVWAVNRAHLTNGLTSTFQFIGRYLPEQLSFRHLAPSNLLGTPPPTGTPNYFASFRPDGFLNIWEFRVNWLHPDASTFGKPLEPGAPNYKLAVSSSPYSGDRIVVPQPGTDERVDSHADRIMTPLQYRIVDGIPSLWAAYTLFNGENTGLHWHEIQFAQDGTPHITQSGEHKPDTHRWRWLPSLAVDRAGNMAIGYSISEADLECPFCPPLYPSIAYAGRLRSDAAGTLPLTENFLWKGTGSQYTHDALGNDIDGPDGPWGRQSQMSVDPLDNCVFWYTNMYYDDEEIDDGTTFQNTFWKTRIGFFALKECRGGATNRVSLSTENVQGNKASGEEFEEWGRTVAISENGRYVAFSSEATNLVPNDNNGKRDVFVRDRDYDGDGIYDEPDGVQTVRITGYNTEDGWESNGNSWEVSISSDGRYVAFSSESSNLVEQDANISMKDVYVYDRRTGEMVRASARDGYEYLAGNNESDQPFIAGDGRYVAFRSSAFDLVAGDTNWKPDIFVRDLRDDRTYRVSLYPPAVVPRQLVEESATPTLSDDGLYVAFATRDPNLAPNALGAYTDTNLDPSGALPVGAGWDVFVARWQTGAVVPISYVDGGGALAGAGIAGAESYFPYISGSGNQVAFVSRANDILPAGEDTNGLADIFVWDRTLGTFPQPIARVSVNFFGNQAINGDSFSPSISRNGQYVAFSSYATNLDAFLPDTNGQRDIFLHDRGLAAFGIYNVGYTQRISLDYNRGEANGGSVFPAVAALGDYVAFASFATDLVDNDSNGVWDVFAYDFARNIPIFLRIPGNVPARPGDTVYVPVNFTRNGYNLDTTIFSVDFDETCLQFTDGPGAVTFSVPSDFITSYSYNSADKDGEIDFSIYDQLAPRASLPDGALATIRFQVKATCQAIPGQSNTARVGFSSDPSPSFASFGQSIKGRAADGFIRIQDGLPGDCNGDGKVDAGDMSAVVLEIFDGDGANPLDTPNPTFPGNPVGCNPNSDTVVDAGDISCTALISWGYTCGTSSPVYSMPLVSKDNASQVKVVLPEKVLAWPGTRVIVPVYLDAQDNFVNSVVFSLDYDHSWLSFDDTDSDGDGVPDAITASLPDGFVMGVGFDAADTDGELDFAIYNLAVPNVALADGALLYLTLDTVQAQGTFLAEIKSSSDLLASFGSVDGFSLAGSMQDGSVWISDLLKRIFLPMVTR